MFKAIILGIIEGLTEFLPVSSTGHLILFNELLAFEGPFADQFAVMIQMGAILSVLVYFWKDLVPTALTKEGLMPKVSLWSKVAVGILPAGLLGVLFEDVIDRWLFNPFTVGAALMAGAVWILLIDKQDRPQGHIDTIEALTYKKALGIGLFQCLALIPGMSRSAMTIIGGLLLGASRRLAAEFSFFMAIPVLAGAGLFKLIKYGVGFTTEQWQLLATGTLVSFVVAYAVIKLFMGFIKKHTFRPFAYYRIVLGAVIFMILL